MAEGTRLNKYLAECGICSRREADRLIEEGRVQVNGCKASTGSKVMDEDTVIVSGKEVRRQEQRIVLAYYKPVGVTCTEKDKFADKKITDMVRFPVRVTYAGRLDKDSEGLMILTNDGDLIQAMMKGANGHEKEYVVRVDKEIDQEFLDRMAAGVYLKELDVTTRPCKLEKVGKYTFRLILTQGVNRQIRRMCKNFGYDVKSLKRVRVMNILLDKLQNGQFRQLSGDELEQLYQGCGLKNR